MRKRGLRIESPGRGHSGFGDDELEKPCFSHEGCSPKVPCVLSSEGTKPVVQVNNSVEKKNLTIPFKYKSSEKFTTK